jgi:hypothetical protein
MTPVQVCSICGGPIVGFGNNAQPVNDGLCCDRCHERVVVPALLGLRTGLVPNSRNGDCNFTILQSANSTKM